jgi:hypothetical protein
VAVLSQELRDLVLEFCTIKDIHSLLKAAEGHDSVRLTAPNLTTLVDKNLQDAIKGNAVALDSVFSLVREAEENGHQDIFYYEAAASEVRNVAIAAVGKRLWGDGWVEKMKFPRFKLKENDFVYADLRQWNPKKPLDWVLKIYGQQFFEEQEGGDEKIDEHTVRRTFVMRPRRIVLVLRWNSPDLLEIRIPQTSAKQRMKSWLDQAWEMVTPVFNSSNFTVWNLDTARRRLITEQGQHTKVYRFSHSRLEDEGHNMISVASAHTERSLEASTPVVKSMQALVKPGVGECRYLRVTWLHSEGKDLPEQDLVSYLGDREVNGVGIGRRCSAREIDYVTQQLREFSKQDS